MIDIGIEQELRIVTSKSCVRTNVGYVYKKTLYRKLYVLALLRSLV